MIVPKDVSAKVRSKNLFKLLSPPLTESKVSAARPTMPEKPQGSFVLSVAQPSGTRAPTASVSNTVHHLLKNTAANGGRRSDKAIK